MALTQSAPGAMQDDPQLIKERLRLLEQDRKTFFETSSGQIKQNKETIRQLRRDNKELKSTITQSKRGTGTLLEKEARQLDDAIYRATLKLDNLKNEGTERKGKLKGEREKLHDIETESQPLLTEDHPLTRKIRMLENRLDKSLIKYNEALSIKKTYEQIVKRLKEERVGFDNQLAAIERTLRAKDHDYQELIKMSHNANHEKEKAKKELEDFKQWFDQQRKNKDWQLSERKTYVQSRVEQTHKLEKKEKNLRQKEQEETKARMEEEAGQRRAQLAQGPNNQDSTITEEEQERLAQYEAAFRVIQEATGVSDVNEVHQKFVSQNETHQHLVKMSKDAQDKIDKLNTEKAELTSKLEELRYSGSGQLGSRRIVEEFEVHLAEAENQTKINCDKYEELAKLLINVKGGIEHLVDRLSVFRSEMAAPVISDETLVDVLKHCETKLVNLAEETVPSDTAEEAALVTAAIDLPIHNRRVRLPNDEGEDDMDDDLDVQQDDQDDDAVLKRDQVKKISANSIQREAKKMKRKRRDK